MDNMFWEKWLCFGKWLTMACHGTLFWAKWHLMVHHGILCTKTWGKKQKTFDGEL